jgi:glycosyltransferase involved in cell wall biosynthesis
MQTFVILPALNEAACIGEVVRQVLQQNVARVIVVDNGSTDETARVAHDAGAFVISETRRGYGYACAAGVNAARDADVIVFMDADGSFLASELPRLLEPIQQQRADLVLGARVAEKMQAGAMPPQQKFGNALTAFLVRALYKIRITDVGPYRAVKRELVDALHLQEMTYGYPTEMIVKAARQKARIVEVPVSYRARRAGQSKVSGTLRGTLFAGYRMLRVTLRHAI